MASRGLVCLVVGLLLVSRQLDLVAATTATTTKLDQGATAIGMNPGDSAAMLALKSSLGVTFTSWADGVSCQVKGESSSTLPTWAKVLCDATGSIVSIELKNDGLSGSIHADISKLTALTLLALQQQLFQADVSHFASNLFPLTGIKEIHLPNNWLYGSLPSNLLNLDSLTFLGVAYNYLTGSLPVASSQLSSMDLRANFFYDMPTLSLTWCDGHTNCFTSPSKCGMGGTTQRPAAECAICGSTNGQPPFCGGAETCAPDSSGVAAQGMPNLPASPSLVMACSGVAMDASDAAVLLALKASLGVTLTSWNPAALCTLEGKTLLPAQWGGIQCTAAGKVTSVALTRQGLKGSLHQDVSKLTTLTYLDLGYNLLQGRLDVFAAPLNFATTLKALFFHYNFFSGPIPSGFASLPLLTSLGLFSNYLTGTVPIPSKSLRVLDLGFNFLSGTFPKLPLVFCAGDNNCFLNASGCRTYGTVQRLASAACAMCGSDNGQGELCPGGTCAPLADAAVSAATVNSPNAPVLPMACKEYAAGAMEAVSAVALLNIKVSAGSDAYKLELRIRLLLCRFDHCCQ
ncbi:hypothetical protein CLOM_g8102 [Closterium sp. NIES-68]|nr:hypothetical protein CLOM_g8102 [Closterium sp. NIES-68]